MNINLPANVKSVFFQMQNLISFNFIPVSSIPMYSWFAEDSGLMVKLDFEDAESTVAYRFGEQFETYGYEHPNMVQNLGSGFVWLILSLFY